MKTFPEIKKLLLSPLYSKRTGDAVDFLGPFFVASYCLLPVASSATGAAYELPLFAAGLIIALTAYITQRFFNRGSIDYYGDFSGYESTAKGFRLKKAAGSLAIGVILAVITAVITGAYLPALDKYYTDSISLLAFISGIYVFLMALAGSIASFYPSMRLVSGRGATICFIILTVATVINAYLGNFTTFGFTSYACLVMYFICYIYGSNRITLRHMNYVTVGSDITNETNGINLAVCSMLVLCFLVLFLVLYASISGFMTLILLLLYVLAGALSGSRTETDDTLLYSVSGEVNTNPNIDLSASDTMNLIIYLLVTAFVIVFFIWMRKHSRRNIFNLLAGLLRRFVDFLLSPIMYFMSFERGDKKEAEDEETFLNYVDESERIKNDPHIGTASEATDSWHSFQSAFNSKKTVRERFRFAYAQYVHIMRRKFVGMKESDTPRRTEAILTGVALDNDARAQISEFSSEFERIEFAEGAPDKMTEKLTSSLVKIIGSEMK